MSCHVRNMLRYVSCVMSCTQHVEVCIVSCHVHNMLRYVSCVMSCTQHVEVCIMYHVMYTTC